MIQHFLTVGAGIFFSVWATVLTQYHHFQGPQATTEPERPRAAIVIESPGVGSSSPSPLGNLIDDIAKRVASSSITIDATTTKVAPSRPVGPVTPTTPSVPFKPLPVPATPPITPTSPATPTPPKPVVVTPPAPSVDDKLSDEALLKAAVVNIICLPGGGLRGSSGSGIVIDPRGLIITVAHVGQNFLLRDYPTKGAGKCYIRTGSPAKNAYSAELVYLSPQWLRENRATFLESHPSGTGENDFAFLVITGSITGTPLPSRFTYVPLSVPDTKIKTRDYVGTASYAAEFLSSSELRSSLYPTIKFASVDDVYTFGRNTTDIFSVAAGSAAQEGSSGGGVMNTGDRLIGVISTRTVKADLSQRSLQAITMDHIRRTFRSDTGADLDAYMKADTATLISKFKDTYAALLSDLSEAIAQAR